MDYHPRGALSYSIFIQALSGASPEIEFRECAALLLPPTPSRNKVAAKERNKEVQKMNSRLNNVCAYRMALPMIFALLLMLQNIPTYAQSVYISIPPRYSLIQGIETAIDMVAIKGGVVSVDNVMEELEAMRDVHEVSLPYHYTRASTTGKDSRGFLKGKDKQKYAEVKKLVAGLISKRQGLVEIGECDSEPNPRDFKKREEFIAAYVKYKMDHVREEDLQKYKGKIGGAEGNYRRDVRNAASRLWQESVRK